MANSAIWRCSTGSGAEASNTGDRIEFNEEPIPENGKQITQSEFEMNIGIAENERPKGQINEYQDVGLDSIKVVITGCIKNPANNSVVAQVKKWAIENKFTTTFPKGRFGLRLDDFPGFDLTPTATRGYMLKDFRWVREGEWKGRAAFIATLIFNGSVGTDPYTW